jgi:hypothetical protein
MHMVEPSMEKPAVTLNCQWPHIDRPINLRKKFSEKILDCELEFDNLQPCQRTKKSQVRKI